MGIRLSGSFRRYLVPGIFPRPDDDSLYQKLRDHRFRSIDDQPISEASTGWVTANSYGSSDFQAESVFFGPCMLLRLRVDQKKLPANALRLRVKEALGEMGGGKVAASAKKKVTEEVEKELLTRTVPSTTLLDIYWRYNEQNLLVAGTQSALNDKFIVLFRDTFGHAPVPATPTPLAERIGSPEVDIERLRRLMPLPVDLNGDAGASYAGGNHA